MTHPSPEHPPLDVETALRSADEALALRLGTVTREEIDVRTAELCGRVGLFADEVLDRAVTPAARSVRWEVDRLLASTPRDGALVFAAYQHLHDLARMLRRLAGSVAGQGSEPVAPVGPVAPVAPAAPAAPAEDGVTA
ncbi:hypothetical protein ACFU6R_07190 [Streptomyces sp. NPDC057499]|uniref:hypothetical protein n=1 Tax=Streptomyces sp. NPDC057499 TaxID=3346150 RepID=UPI003697581F